MDIKRKIELDAGISLEIGHGDITRLDVDAIVNAANSQLNHGGGVARAIASKGGEQVIQESREWVRQHGPVAHEAPAYTRAGDLPCKYVIHAVGPVWGDGDEDRKLAAAIRGSLDRARELELKSIAFPAISAGIFGFPVQRAARIFMQEANRFAKEGETGSLENIQYVLYDQDTLAAFMEAFDQRFTINSQP